MGDFHIRVHEPGMAAEIRIKAVWHQDVTAEQMSELLCEAYAAAQHRIDA